MKIQKSNYIGRQYRQPYRRPGLGSILGIAGAIASRSLGRKYNNWSGTRTQGKRTTSGQGVTSQYDRKVVYRKKAMPYRKKRQWKSFVRKVNAALMKEVGTKTVIRNTQINTVFADDTQQFVACCLYGKDGSTDSSIRAGHDDLKQIFLNDAELSDPTSRAKFFSGVLDLTLTNLSTVTSGNNNASLEVDLYEMAFTKYVDNTAIGNMLTVAAANTSAINGAVTQITMNSRGATPFEFPDFLAQGVKILKKTKYFLSPGQCATYQYRDPKNFSIRKDVVDNGDDNFAMPWKTRGILFVSKGVPTADATQVLKSLQVGVTRKYGYKIIQKSTDADNVIP